MIDNIPKNRDKDWLLQTKETRRTFAKSTWIPLRASQSDKEGCITSIGYVEDLFCCGSVAFSPDNKNIADTLGWDDIGISNTPQPYAFKDGYYSSIEQYNYGDKNPIGINLIFEYPQPVIGGSRWMLNPDLIVALRLIKEGNVWVRPEEDFVVVIKEFFDKKGNHSLIEIKKEFLIDYLAARNLSLRLSCYRQRVDVIEKIEGSTYSDLSAIQDPQRDGGEFELRINSMNDIYGGSFASFRVWRTDIDEDEDAPIMGPENDNNTASENSEGYISGYKGVRLESDFWRNEWIEHQGLSTRVRGDMDPSLPLFVTGTDGTRVASADLNNEEIGQWLAFRSDVISELLTHRGFYLEWYSGQTGGICSTSGYTTHFGINQTDLISVYAYDIAKLYPWEQRIWAAHSVVPEKVSEELLLAQIKTKPAQTQAVETKLFQSMRMLGEIFHNKFGAELYIHDLDYNEFSQQIYRFSSKDLPSLLRLAKELVRIFTERLNKKSLILLSTHKDKKSLGSNKLLESVLAEKIGKNRAYEIFSVIIGVYDMRLGDAHLTSSTIEDALKLAQIDNNYSFLRQGEQLIFNFGRAIYCIGNSLDKVEENY